MSTNKQAEERQAGVIPWRQREGVLEILLITNSSRRRWQVPKGNLEPFLTNRETAAMEAWEEAGIRGELSEDPCALWPYEKRGQRKVVELYTMRVEEVLDRWPEMFERRRIWVSFEHAAAKIADPRLRSAIAELPAAIQAASYA